MRRLIVSKHRSFHEFVKDLGIVGEHLEWIGPRDAFGAIIFGAVPLDVAARAAMVLVPRFAGVPHDAMHRELTLEELKQYFVGWRAFMAKEVDYSLSDIMGVRDDK